MHPWRATLELLGRLRTDVPEVAPAAPVDLRLERARAALVDAREQMPGLLGMTGGGKTPAADRTQSHDAGATGLPALSPQSGAVANGRNTELGAFARVEEVIMRLDEERRQLGAEVAALRLIVEELRETLVRADERVSLAEPIFSEPFEGPAVVSDPENAEREEPERPVLTTPAFQMDDTLYPAGSVGVELRLLSVDGPASLEELRIAIAALTEIEMVRVTSVTRDEAGLRLYLRFPRTQRQLLDLLQRVAPAAKPLAAAAPGSLLLRLRPP